MTLVLIPAWHSWSREGILAELAVFAWVAQVCYADHGTLHSTAGLGEDPMAGRAVPASMWAVLWLSGKQLLQTGK